MIARGAGGAYCAVCGIAAGVHPACAVCFVAGAYDEPAFSKLAHGIKLCGHCRAEQRDQLNGYAWNESDFQNGGAEPDDVDVNGAPTSLRDMIKMGSGSGRGRPRDRQLDARILPLLFDREKVELVPRRPPRRRTWSTDKRGRYRCSACYRRGHNRRSCDGKRRRQRRQRGTYVRRSFTSRREIARMAGCGQMSVDRRYHELFRANFARTPPHER